MPDPVAYLNGEFIPARQLALPVFDAGFVLGVTVAEQIRTFRGELFRLDQHLQRLARSLEIVSIDPGFHRDELARAAQELAARNHACGASDDDLGLSMFVTPGPYATMASAGGRHGPTVCMHTYPLPFALWAHLYEQGQALRITDVRQVPSNCWPAELKCRSRMHYYLADLQARQRESGSRALLLDQHGSVLEASTANILAYRRDEGLISPPAEKILPGISVGVIQDLCGQLGVPLVHRDLTPEDLHTAEEVLLTSTSPCVWPVLRLDGQTICGGRPGEIGRRLRRAWSEMVGVDIAAQALRFADR